MPGDSKAEEDLNISDLEDALDSIENSNYIDPNLLSENDDAHPAIN
jgi:hypothetical protein